MNYTLIPNLLDPQPNFLTSTHIKWTQDSNFSISHDKNLFQFLRDYEKGKRYVLGYLDVINKKHLRWTESIDCDTVDTRAL